MKIRYFDLVGIIPWYVAYVLMKKRVVGAHVSAYTKISVPVMSLIESILPAPIGKNLLLVGQKEETT